MPHVRGILIQRGNMKKKVKSDGSTASYYELPKGSTQIIDLMNHKNMNLNIGSIFQECYRYGEADHCDQLRGAKKIKFYIEAEIKRLEGEK